MVGMASTRGCCLACSLVSSAWMYSSVPTGNPRTRRPRWALGWSWPPTQTASDCDKAVMPGGTVPEAFHTDLYRIDCFPHCQEVVSIERIYSTKKWVPKGKNCNPHAGALGAPNF